MSTLTTIYGGGVQRADKPFRAFNGLATRISGTLQTYWSGRNDTAELRALSDRDLADIGLSRNELPVDLRSEIEAVQRAIGFTYSR